MQSKKIWNNFNQSQKLGKLPKFNCINNLLANTTDIRFFKQTIFPSNTYKLFFTNLYNLLPSRDRATHVRRVEGSLVYWPSLLRESSVFVVIGLLWENEENVEKKYPRFSVYIFSLNKLLTYSSSQILCKSQLGLVQCAGRTCRRAFFILNKLYQPPRRNFPKFPK